MGTLRELILDHLSGVIATVVALIAGAAIAIPMALWSNSVSVSETTARVISVGAPVSEQYQCGTNKVGDVSIPIYCYRTVYPTTFSVANTDESFSSKLSSSPTVGTDYKAYKVVDGNSYYHSLSSPQDFSFYILIVVLSIVGAIIAGVIAFVITEHFTY